MKKRLIKWLGGYTQIEYSRLQNAIKHYRSLPCANIFKERREEFNERIKAHLVGSDNKPKAKYIEFIHFEYSNSESLIDYDAYIVTFNTKDMEFTSIGDYKIPKELAKLTV